MHDPGVMPFEVPWTDRAPDAIVAGMVSYHRALREGWRPERWSLALVVFDDGPIGVIELRGERFAETRRFETGSWLAAAAQGRGLGTEMRQAALELGFAGLGGRVAVSSAFDVNVASLRVSEALGYRRVGEATAAPRPEVIEEYERHYADMRNGKYKEELWKTYTGKTPDELWDLYIATLTK